MVHRATLVTVEALTPWLTPALLVALVAWLRSEFISRTDKLEKRFDARFDAIDKRFEGVDARFDAIDKRFEGVDKRFEGVGKRFDGVIRELADLRERMAKLEGALDGFLAGRRDGNAA